MPALDRLEEIVVVHVDSLTVRCIGAVALLSSTCWLIALLARDYQDGAWEAAGRLGWSLTVLAAVALIARGIFLGRPVTALHAAGAALVLIAGLGAHVVSLDVFGDVLIVGSGLVLMWPTSARPRPEDLPRVWALINATAEDPLAPFAMQAGKSYHFSPAGTAALAYRTRMGFAVVSGDPLGEEKQFVGLVADFAAMCHTRGWRIAVVGCSERRLPLWNDPGVLGQSLRPIPFGRDVVIDVTSFTMMGRKFRNLRQAVQRTHNFGITTEIVAEQALDDIQRAELAEVLSASPKGSRTDRGFCMNLDGVLEGRYPGVELIVARDASGRVLGFHRFTTAGGGKEVSLDVPRRRRGAPNGIDERLSIDMIAAAKEAGALRVSLAFAAFPEIFDQPDRSRLQYFFYILIHLLDPLIALESLYRYLRKFHALDARRYALISPTHVMPFALVLLSLEFLPRRRHL
ncbi:bifunctional lysylphosphatidylglycerol flippase/synthetase MprF [Mycobacterium spongiae]|uniref:bifunctional lysylphosphatidylglycerol flippase/synthetase MprF n=1 Tax=Mycobacterium spongiae TaxID=886343 RepID=UPI001FE8F4BF|nr:phosphatidylglycerol lysyltransferase domain-containing protein [Mycobacterium spongiae]